MNYRMTHPRLCLIAVCLFSVNGLASLALGADSPAITHSFLATGGKTFIWQVKAGATEGKIAWEYPASTREGWVLPNGNVLLAISKGGAYPGGAAIEVTLEKKIIWEYKGTQEELNSVQKTTEGNYVVTESGKNPRLLEINAAGKTVVEFALKCQNHDAHMETRMARKLADGTYLVPHLLDFAVKQYDRTGKVLAVIDTTTPGDPNRNTHSWPFTAIRLPNGNTLVGLTNANAVAEFDPSGKRVWELTNEQAGGIIRDACGVQRLPNGNTIVNSYGAGANQPKIFEVTPDKKVVWTFMPKEGGGIHHMHIIDTNGVPLKGVPLR